MGNVVQLFKKLTPAAAKITIIDNLKNIHHGKVVNSMCATRGVDDFSMALNMLQSLIEENVVMIKRIPLKDKHGVNHYAPLYWYNFNSDYNG